MVAKMYSEVLRQLDTKFALAPTNISIDGNPLKNVDSLKYLGSFINSAANLDNKIL